MQESLRSGRSPLLMTRIAAFVAIGVVSGWAESIPNVELVTAVCFSAGFLLGEVAGLLTGALTEIVFAGFHPMGSSMGFLLVSQIAGMMGAGFLGGLARTVLGETRGWRFAGVIVIAGAVSTIWFDLITNLSYPLAVRASAGELKVYMAAAVPFAAIHVLSNMAVFAFIVVPLLPRLRKALSW